MFIQTTDDVLYNISIFSRDNEVDCAVDMLQLVSPLHLNAYETAYLWRGDSSSLHDELDFWESVGYIVEMEVIDK